MFFPIAGIDLNPLIPVFSAFLISFFTSMGGISGAFLLLPFQVSVLGFSSPAVSATNLLYNVIAIPGGAARYIKEQRMVWTLTGVVITGGLPGIFLGMIFRLKFFPDPKRFKFFAGIVLLLLGVRLIINLLGKKKLGRSAGFISNQPKTKNYIEGDAKNNEAGERICSTVSTNKFGLSQSSFMFAGNKYVFSTHKVIFLSFIIGTAGGIYGIGGGAFLAPLIVVVFRLPVHAASGALLLGTWSLSLAGVGFYSLAGPYFSNMIVQPDWMLGLCFGIGGFTGIYCGARFQKYVSPIVIEGIITACVLFIALRYIIGFFLF